jgi:hypothetical protein
MDADPRSALARPSHGFGRAALRGRTMGAAGSALRAHKLPFGTPPLGEGGTVRPHHVPGAERFSQPKRFYGSSLMGDGIICGYFGAVDGW